VVAFAFDLKLANAQRVADYRRQPSFPSVSRQIATSPNIVRGIIRPTNDFLVFRRRMSALRSKNIEEKR
jgi:hypothetical protein